jgi:pimeloyl-ACP methyl ester carboxylesterase
VTERRALLVIHDAGDADAATRWAALVEAWPGPALAPDLPGHGRAKPPEGATYAASDAAIAAFRALQDAGLAGTPAVLVGHGWGGYAAELLAAAGRAEAVVLVDGLGGRSVGVDGLVADQHRWLREVLADPAALAPPTEVPDPRLAHGFPTIWEPSYVQGLRAALSVPVLAVETPSSPTPTVEKDRRLLDFAGGARLVECSEPSGTAVAGAMRAAGWL